MEANGDSHGQRRSRSRSRDNRRSRNDRYSARRRSRSRSEASYPPCSPGDQSYDPRGSDRSRSRSHHRSRSHTRDNRRRNQSRSRSRSHRRSRDNRRRNRSRSRSRSHRRSRDNSRRRSRSRSQRRSPTPQPEHRAPDEPVAPSSASSSSSSSSSSSASDQELFALPAASSNLAVASRTPEELFALCQQLIHEDVSAWDLANVISAELACRAFHNLVSTLQIHHGMVGRDEMDPIEQDVRELARSEIFQFMRKTLSRNGRLYEGKIGGLYTPMFAPTRYDGTDGFNLVAMVVEPPSTPRAVRPLGSPPAVPRRGLARRVPGDSDSDLEDGEIAPSIASFLSSSSFPTASPPPLVRAPHGSRALFSPPFSSAATASQPQHDERKEQALQEQEQEMWDASEHNDGAKEAPKKKSKAKKSKAAAAPAGRVTRRSAPDVKRKPHSE